ncbi:transposase [Streptomyces sp. NPDC002812]|uniref:transposase n=1 Tax=Streptomyces sp. NPDC002812 TaxID=3154434 RepID=UPI00332EF7FD
MVTAAARRGTPSRTTGRFAWLSPTALWPLARHLLATGTVRPQGGGTRRADEEAVFAAVLYILVSGESWRALPKSFPVSWQNAHRRFGQWCEEDLWNRMAATARATPHISAPVRDWAERVAEAARSRRPDLTDLTELTGLTDRPDLPARTDLRDRPDRTTPTDIQAKARTQPRTQARTQASDRSRARVA